MAAASVPPIEVLACVQYAKNYLPWLQKLDGGVPVLTGPGLLVSVLLMAVFGIDRGYRICLPRLQAGRRAGR